MEERPPSISSGAKHKSEEKDDELKMEWKREGDGKDQDHDTLSRGNPIAEFLRLQKGNIKGLSQEEFLNKYETFVKEQDEAKEDSKLSSDAHNVDSKNSGGSSSSSSSSGSSSSGSSSSGSSSSGSSSNNNNSNNSNNNNSNNSNNSSSSSSSSSSSKGDSTPHISGENNESSIGDSSAAKGSERTTSMAGSNEDFGENNFSAIVLKFTTLSEGCQEAPSFTVDRNGARIGSSELNSISIPSDTRLAKEGHSIIEYNRGAFYIIDGGYTFAASIRIGVGSTHNKKWYIDRGARFSAGNSVFESMGLEQQSGELLLSVLEGPLKGSILTITHDGATFGRSSDNTISVPDRELSRRHSNIVYDKASNRYIVDDMGSTNGTYVQIVGPYKGRYRLNLNDHILVGRTGFSVNRFDYGLSEEMGYRQSMEDACAIVQHLNIGPLCSRELSPQSFFGVFDGHGGSFASHYLAQHLHINVAHGLLSISDEIFQIFDDVAPNSIFSAPSAMDRLDELVIKSLKTIFLQTDKDFISTSPNPQHGSTATTALLLGKRLYCANVGDSRTMICRNFQPIVLSEDHKPTREDESKRIRDAGGFVINNRVMGELAVSRAFGDVDFKKGIQSILEEEDNHRAGSELSRPRNSQDSEGRPLDVDNWDQPLIIAEPDVQTITIKDNDQFLLLACDGLFDVYTPEEIVKFVTEHMGRHGDTQRCCQSLTHDAIKKRNSRDNVSVILIILSKWY